MRGLVELLAKSLVDRPEAVEVTQSDTPDGVRVVLRVAPDDVGKIIGRGGRIVRSIRTVLKAAAARQGQRVDLEVLP